MGTAAATRARLPAYTIFNLALTVWSMHTFFDEMPRSLEEAAYVDGASVGQAFWRIVLPLTAPGMASVGSDESWLPSPSAYGSAGNENIFLVNGVNATIPRGAPWGSLGQVNYDTVEQVKVLSLGSRAE